MFHFLQLFFFAVVIGFLLNPHLLLITSQPLEYHNCYFSAHGCPNGDIQYPFYDSEGYFEEYERGYPGLSAKCSEGGRPIITFSNHSYYYKSTRGFMDITLWDIDIADQRCPQPRHNFSLEGVVASSLSLHDDDYYRYVSFFYNCSSLPKDVEPNLPCIDQSNYYTGSSFAMWDSKIPVGFDWYANCQLKATLPVAFGLGEGEANYTYVLKFGFDLRLQRSEDCRICEESGGCCSYNRNSTSFMCACDYGQRLFDKRCPHSSQGKLIIGLSAGIGGSLLMGGSLLILLFVYIRCSKTTTTNVEILLQNHKSDGLQRYKYSDIKKMTKSFKDTLGQGGFGSVFKGKLSDGRMVAVKLLNKSKGDGEEFINEVVTIGRTNHVNVVTLIGFCNEGTKQALIYEFMVNGSLEKFIYKEKSSIVAYAPSLGWEKLYQIALGVARGLEYLHRGCNNRILHFDIKPHNILLNVEFVPKISDFGLAKLSQTRESVVSMVGTRGTSGYIAPELYCRNFGVVSYKSDIYSYGMMLFEMIGGRKNIDVTVDNISEIYFPHWIYNHLNKEKEIEGSEDMKIDVSKDILENEIARKMIIVALWCIQAHPINRPSMNKVVEMLEGSNDKLQMPPNPSLDPSPEVLPLSV